MKLRTQCLQYAANQLEAFALWLRDCAGYDEDATNDWDALQWDKWTNAEMPDISTDAKAKAFQAMSKNWNTLGDCVSSIGPSHSLWEKYKAQTN